MTCGGTARPGGPTLSGSLAVRGGNGGKRFDLPAPVDEKHRAFVGERLAHVASERDRGERGPGDPIDVPHHADAEQRPDLVRRLAVSGAQRDVKVAADRP